MQCKFFSCASSATRMKKKETDFSDFDHVKPHCLAVANAKFVFLRHVAKGFECFLLLWAFLLSHRETTKIHVKCCLGTELWESTQCSEPPGEEDEAKFPLSKPKLCLWQAIPSQAVCEGGGARHVAFPIDHAAIAARTQRPEGGGGAWQIQTDVPERVYRRGNTTVGNRRVPHTFKGSQINSFSLALGCTPGA